MKSIHSTVTGLASSLLLNLGFSALAEKLDPMKNHLSLNPADAGFGCEVCNFGCEVCNFGCEVCNFGCEVCNFSAEAGR
jgi:hypothetical protein